MPWVSGHEVPYAGPWDSHTHTGIRLYDARLAVWAPRLVQLRAAAELMASPSCSVGLPWWAVVLWSQQPAALNYKYSRERPERGAGSPRRSVRDAA